jgi:hypothetical protein
MSIYEYWIGQDINFRGVWADYDGGMAYQEKYQTMRVHLIQLTFESTLDTPLFNHEAIFKTVKGYFHELKRTCLSSHDYEHAGPLFLYEVGRGSSMWSFLGELRQLLLLGTTLADQKVIGQQLKNIDSKLNILKKYFGNSVRPEDFRAFMQAQTSPALEEAVQRMIGEGLRRVRISKRPFKEDPASAQQQMIDLKEIVSEADYGNRK